jgi:hypothetical protein
MSSDWLGLLLSIPIGVCTALATPWIQRRLEEKGKHRAMVKSRNAHAEYSSVLYYKTNPQEFTQYLIHVAIKTTFIGALMGVISGLSFVVAQLVDAPGVGFNNSHMLQTVFYATGQFVALIGSLMIVNICRPALATWTRVRNFDAYERAIKTIM